MEDTGPTRPGLRASDADRDRLAAVLEQHTAAGRLTLEEYSQRVERAFTARTQDELAALLDDLPADADPVLPAADGRQLAVAFLLALLALLVIGLAVAAFR